MVITQSAVVPFRLSEGGPQVLLITTRRGGLWSIPKGHIEWGMTIEDSAKQEAFEEAGVVGDVTGGEIGAYEYIKYGNTHRVSVFLLLVTEILEDWEEKDSRKREWVRQEDAEGMIADEGLREIVRRAFAILSEKESQKRE